MESTVDVVCPYCGEIVTVRVELGRRVQNYHEDCEVCSRPIQVDLRFDRNYNYDVQVGRSSGH